MLMSLSNHVDAFTFDLPAKKYRCFTEEVTSGKVAVGQFEPARVDRSRDVYTEYMQLKRRVPGADLYTSDLLPARK